jgi:hypothetical protein
MYIYIYLFIYLFIYLYDISRLSVKVQTPVNHPKEITRHS